MKIRFAFPAILLALGALQPVLAQGTAQDMAIKSVQIVDARKANAALMRQYSWTSRTELIEDGKVKDTRLELVNFGPTGQPQRSLLNDQSAPLPGGFLRKAIAESERKKMEEYMTGLRGLLEQYTSPTAGKILDFMLQAQITGPDASGAVGMTGHGVVIPGDTVSVWTDVKTQQTRRIQVATTYKGDVVNVTATFNTLRGSKLTYVNYADVNVPAKTITVQQQNFDFHRD